MAISGQDRVRVAELANQPKDDVDFELNLESVIERAQLVNPKKAGATQILDAD